MTNKTQPGPTTPFYKERGKWTFYVFPNGVREEAGEYPNEAMARAASWDTHRAWQTNGYRYESSLSGAEKTTRRSEKL